MTNEEKSSVFISYSTVDQIIAEGVCGYLEANKIRCFVAYRDIPKSVNWAKVIPPAIRNCQLMVAVFSKAFNLSEETDNQIHVAAHHKIPILTFRIVDEEFEGTKEYFLTKSNWLDAFPDPEKHFGDLLRNVQVMLGIRDDGPIKALFKNQSTSHNNEVQKYIEHGVWLLNSLGECHDPMMAAFQFRKAAKNGDAEGQYWMGRCSWNGWGAAQRWKDALDWFSQAANQGHHKAMFEMAKMYHYGIGVQYNPMRALELYTRAAELCNGEAMFFLGKVYRSGELGIQDEQRSNHYYNEAFERLYEQALDCNDADAQFRLGNMYDEGEGVSRDYAQALAWYERSMTNGNMDSINAMALLYQDGRGVRVDESKAFDLKLKAAQNDCRMAQNNIGHDYSHGWGCEKDLNKWLEWKLKAANGGYALAQASLALSYQHGKDSYLKSDWGKAIIWYEKAIESGSLDAMFFMAKNFENGNMGLVHDKERAFQLYKQAAVLGYVPAWWAIGHCFFHGSGTVRSHLDAYRWYCQLLYAFLQWHERLEERWYFSSGAGTISGYRLDFLLDAGLAATFENLSWLLRHGDGIEHNESKANLCEALYKEICDIKNNET
jgi:TPR repeat protein